VLHVEGRPDVDAGSSSSWASCQAWHGSSQARCCGPARQQQQLGLACQGGRQVELAQAGSRYSSVLGGGAQGLGEGRGLRPAWVSTSRGRRPRLACWRRAASSMAYVFPPRRAPKKIFRRPCGAFPPRRSRAAATRRGRALLVMLGLVTKDSRRRYAGRRVSSSRGRVVEAVVGAPAPEQLWPRPSGVNAASAGSGQQGREQARGVGERATDSASAGAPLPHTSSQPACVQRRRARDVRPARAAGARQLALRPSVRPSVSAAGRLGTAAGGRAPEAASTQSRSSRSASAATGSASRTTAGRPPGEARLERPRSRRAGPVQELACCGSRSASRAARAVRAQGGDDQAAGAGREGDDVCLSAISSRR